ncbi:hypothetical protein [Alkaliphilus crotonatoxidans]
MTTINCNHPCLYESDGVCTLTHATSITATTEKSCAYFKDKAEQKKNLKLL